MPTAKNKASYAGEKQVFRAIGLMSGTSMDGIDVAYIETDGCDFVQTGAFATYPYSDEFRQSLRAILNMERETHQAQIQPVEAQLTELHIQAVQNFLLQIKKAAQDIDLIGFHGHSIAHAPQRGLTLQIGNSAHMAAVLGIDVVGDFRVNDVVNGGQGAPLVPVYQRALLSSAQVEMPVAVLNIGGVANITYCHGDDMVAFDTGTGNALIDDVMLKHTGQAYDVGGALAQTGRVDEAVLREYFSADFYSKDAPKSLDRNDFSPALAAHLSPADAVATLTELTVRSVVRAFEFCPRMPRALYVTGGGRHNDFMMARLAALLPCPVHSVDDLGWSGDALEAQAFAYLAVRSVQNLPQTFPMTTGCKAPLTGGVVYPASVQEKRSIVG